MTYIRNTKESYKQEFCLALTWTLQVNKRNNQSEVQILPTHAHENLGRTEYGYIKEESCSTQYCKILDRGLGALNNE